LFDGEVRQLTDIIIQNGKATTTERANIRWFSARPRLEGRTNLSKDGFVSFQASGHNIEVWKSIFPNCVVTDADLEARAFEEFIVGDRSGFSFKREPMPHQQKAFDQFKDKKLAAVFGSVGSGKTKIAVDLMSNYYCNGQIDAVVIVAINKLVIKQWHDSQLPRDVPESVPYQSWVWDKSKKGMADYEALKTFDGLRIVTINIDALRTDPGIDLLKDFIKLHKGRILFAVDESQTAKNPSAQRTKNTIALAKLCDYRMIMSGTPISVNLIDYWAQFKILDENIIGCKYVTSFKSKYLITRWNGFGDEVIGSKNTEELYEKTSPYIFRITKEELGFKDFDDEFEFELGVNEKRHYKELKKTFMTQLDSGEFVSVSNALSAMIRLQQASNGFIQHPDTGELQLLECSRVAALQAWLEMVEDEKLVIWCRYLKDAEIIMSKLGKQATDLSGNVDPDTRYQHVQDFIHDKNIRYAVGTPKSSGVGVDGMQLVTNRAVFYSNSEHALDYWQARARTSRVGGDSNAFYCHLVAKGTVDKKIMQNLLKKEALSSLMLDDLRRMWENED